MLKCHSLYRQLAAFTLLAGSCFAQIAPKGYYWYPDQTVGNTIAREIAVGRGEVWIIGSEEAGGGNFNILHLNGTQFEPVAGGGLKIAVDGNGTPWVVNAQGLIWRYNSTAQRWDQMPGGATEIAAGGNEVWVLGGTTRGVDNDIYRWNGRSWDKVPGQGAKLSVSSTGAAYVANIHGELWQRSNSGAHNWTQIALGVNQVNATPNVGVGIGEDLVMITSTSGLVETLSQSLWYASNGAGSYKQGPLALRIARDEFSSLRAYAILADPQYDSAGPVVIGDPNEDDTYAAPVIANALVTPVPLLGFWIPAKADSEKKTLARDDNYYDGQPPTAPSWLQGVGANWMSYLPDNTPLHKLSIPGTHDSGSRQPLVFSLCQVWDDKAQLEGGIRYFDYRTQNTNGILEIWHGVDQNLTFDAVMSAFDNFLKTNTREVIIMRVSQNDQALWSAMKAKYPRIYGGVPSMTPRPTLGDLRGKIFFLYGSDTTDSRDGVEYPGGGTNANFYVQDAYQISISSGDLILTANRSEKLMLIGKTINEASNSNNNRLVLNGVAGNGYFGGGTVEAPLTVANWANPALSDALPDAKRILGTLIMDFPGEKLIFQILRTNFRFN